MSISASWPATEDRKSPLHDTEQNVARLLASDTWQQEQHTQFNACVIRFEYDINQRLGQHTLQKLQNCGLDLVYSARQNLEQLIQQLHEVFQLERNSSLVFQSRNFSFPSPDKPSYVLDGYCYLHLAEQDVVGLFLRQKSVYKVMLEQLSEHLLRYIEKVYYRIEQQWQEFQSHYMAVDKLGHLADSNHSIAQATNLRDSTSENQNQNTEELSSKLQDLSPEEHSSNLIELSEHEYKIAEPEAARSATAAQIALRHRRIQQLQALARSFWQDNFAAAMAQVQLDLPYWAGGSVEMSWSEGIQSRLAVHKVRSEYPDRNPSNWSTEGHRIHFDAYYINLLRELEQRCSLREHRQNLMLKLRNALEQSLSEETLELKAANGESLEADSPFAAYYREYGNGNCSEAKLPDELLSLDLRYFTKQNLLNWEREKEEQFIRLSKGIQKFFSETEQATRLYRLPILLRIWANKLQRKLQPKILDYSVEKNLAVETFLHTSAQLFPEVFAPVERSLQQGNTLPELRANQAPISLRNKRYEAQLLLELLQKADLALQQQIRFYPQCKHYVLLEQLQDLRRKLLAICQQPISPQSFGGEGVLLRARYRTVAKRCESWHRIERVWQNFRQRCGF